MGRNPGGHSHSRFGSWLLICLLLAVRPIRRDDVINHRRWMIRAFATGVAVGTIRIWLGLLFGTGVLFGIGVLDFHNSFAAAFCIGLSLHVLAAEWWIRTTPNKTG